MQRVVILFAVVLGHSLVVGHAFAGTCVCVKVAMYPAPGGGWLHYAIVYDNTPTPCTQLYPTSWIGPPTSGQSCVGGGQCGTCQMAFNDMNALQELSKDEHFVMFEDEQFVVFQNQEDQPEEQYLSNLATWPDVRDAESFKNYLNAQTNNQFEQHTFEGGPMVVRLQRQGTGNVPTFSAAIWKMKYDADGAGGSMPPGEGYIGVEFAGGGFDNNQRRPIYSQHNTVALRSVPSDPANPDSPKVAEEAGAIPGVLLVQFGDSAIEDVALIWLYDSPANRNANYPLVPRRLPQ